MDVPNWVSASTDTTVPNAARVYDYLLGGGHNFAADRAFAEELEQIMPGANLYASATRAFVHRAVRWLTEYGIQQFLDIGSGIPTVGNVHEIAQRATPHARVAYIDIDPVAVAHSEALLANDPHTQVFQADLAHPDQVLSHPGVLTLLDFVQPVAVLLNAVVHFLPDTAHPEQVLAHLRDAVAPGSYLTLTHGTPIQQTDLGDQQNRARELYQRTPHRPLLPYPRPDPESAGRLGPRQPRPCPRRRLEPRPRPIPTLHSRNARRNRPQTMTILRSAALVICDPFTPAC